MVRGLVDLHGFHLLKANPVIAVGRGINFHSSRVNHANPGLRGGVHSLSLGSQKSRAVQSNQGEVPPLAQALGRGHSDAKSCKGTRPTSDGDGLQGLVFPCHIVQHLFDQWHEPLRMDVALGSFLPPGKRPSIFCHRHRALFGGGVNQKDTGHQCFSASRASPEFSVRLTMS